MMYFPICLTIVSTIKSRHSKVIINVKNNYQEKNTVILNIAHQYIWPCAVGKVHQEKVQERKCIFDIVVRVGVVMYRRMMHFFKTLLFVCDSERNLCVGVGYPECI